MRVSEPSGLSADIITSPSLMRTDSRMSPIAAISCIVVSLVVESQNLYRMLPRLQRASMGSIGY